MSKVNFSNVARDLMFGGRTTELELIAKHKLQYRKGKDSHSIAVAIKNAKKNGHYRTETELSMLELYLKDVFKTTEAKDV